jgi:hypothetical protein
MTDAFDSLMSSASESCTPDEMRALKSHIAATLGNQDAVDFCKRIEKAVARREPLTLFEVDYSVTSGDRKLTAEQVREAVEKRGTASLGCRWQFTDRNLQAIADELNAALGGMSIENAVERIGRFCVDYVALWDRAKAIPTLGKEYGDCEWAESEMIHELAHDLATLGTEINGDTSDGYHTFNELYHHRAVLFSVVVAANSGRAWKSKLHHDGTMYEGMFIVGVDTPQGQATYHYDLVPYWDMFWCRELERAPEWDGHTPDDAIERIGSLRDVVFKGPRGRW